MKCMNWLKRLMMRVSRTPRPPDVPELTVEELHLSRERGLEMKLQHPAFTLLADELCSMFDEAGAINYVEYTIYSEKYGPMRVCIQRVEGETPAMQNIRLRTRVAELENAQLNSTPSTCSEFKVDSCCCWSDGTTKGQCLCGVKEIDHKPKDEVPGCWGKLPEPCPVVGQSKQENSHD